MAFVVIVDKYNGMCM